MQSCGSMPMNEDGKATQLLPEEDEEQAEAVMPSAAPSTSNPSPPDVKCSSVRLLCPLDAATRIALVEGRQQGVCSPTRASPTRRACARPATRSRTPRVPRPLEKSRLGSLSIEAGPLAGICAQSRGDLREQKRSPRVRRAGRPSSKLRSARSMEHVSSCLVGRARACGQGVRTRRMDAGRTHVLKRTAGDSRAPHRI
ncbi:hypothetical protein T492DRAFT_988909 [Pavlovales sp. CCMP2436]|nr:hypothetical protein T492DRAFT_988909 [Pavlovales sp. CCMP2436]